MKLTIVRIFVLVLILIIGWISFEFYNYYRLNGVTTPLTPLLINFFKKPEFVEIAQFGEAKQVVLPRCAKRTLGEVREPRYTKLLFINFKEDVTVLDDGLIHTNNETSITSIYPLDGFEKAETTSKCWVAYYGDRVGTGEIAYEDKSGEIKTLGVVGFPVPNVPTMNFEN